jgi:hypothetical protein
MRTKRAKAKPTVRMVTRHIKAMEFRPLRELLSARSDTARAQQLRTYVQLRQYFMFRSQKYNSTPQRVARDEARDKTARNKGNVEVLEDFFGYTIIGYKSKRQGEFIQCCRQA